jgi:hypothetical protein
VCLPDSAQSRPGVFFLQFNVNALLRIASSEMGYAYLPQPKPSIAIHSYILKSYFFNSKNEIVMSFCITLVILLDVALSYRCKQAQFIFVVRLNSSSVLHPCIRPGRLRPDSRPYLKYCVYMLG